MRNNLGSWYENYSLFLTPEQKDSVKNIKDRLYTYKEIQPYASYISVLPLKEHLSHSAQWLGRGIVSISPRILQEMKASEGLLDNLQWNQIFQKIINFLLVHESLHIIFSIGFQYLYKNHKDLLDTFHNHILQEAIREENEVSYDKDFIEKKSHFLLAGENSPNIETFMEKYFWALQKNMIIEPKTAWIWYALPFNLDFSFKEYSKAKSIATEILYNQDKQSFSKKLLTWFHASEDIEQRIKTLYELWEEEWLVNYIAWLMTGIDVTEVNKYCPQDLTKLEFTKKLQEKGLSIDECLSRVKTWQDINNLY